MRVSYYQEKHPYNSSIINYQLSMDLISLRLFVRVVEEGTISLAAQREHIAAAAISRRIADLEDQLNTPLLRRTNKGVHPTQAGLELLYRARSVLNSVENIKTHIQGYSQGQQGHIHQYLRDFPRSPQAAGWFHRLTPRHSFKNRRKK